MGSEGEQWARKGGGLKGKYLSVAPRVDSTLGDWQGGAERGTDWGTGRVHE